MRVLVTGGAGSIGVYVVRGLLARGDTVAIVDDFNDFYDPAFKRFRLERVLQGVAPPVVLETDITDAEALSKAVGDARPDVIVHLAAWPSVQPSVRYPALYTHQNVVGAVNVFQCAVDHEVRGVIFASSSSVYGRDTPAPFREDAPCDHLLAPYGASKRAAELYAQMYHYRHQLPIACLRFFTIYGPWIRPDMALWKFTERIVRGAPVTLRRFGPGGEEAKRDFTYIDDAVRGVLASLDHLAGFDIVNLGNDDPVSLDRFVRAIEAGLGKQAVVEGAVLLPEEAIVTAADLTHAQEKLGYVPTTSVEEGIQRFTSWYLEEFLPAFPNGLAPSRYWA